MRLTITRALFVVSILIFNSCQTKENWTSLLDKDLSKWRIYQSYRHELGYKGEVPKDAKGDSIAPIGYDKNENNVFTVIEEDGEPVLRVSGEIYGCVFTKEDFENYHLKIKYKWGSKKWVPRLQEDMDSGILYHSQGEAGVDYWKSWMLAQEFQIIENSSGDYWPISDVQIDIKASKAAGTDTLSFDNKSKSAPFGVSTPNGIFCKAGGNYENARGEWNTVELISVGDKSLHIINGKVAMALSNSRFLKNKVSQPLVKGKLQLQSEAAEVFYKDIQIRKVTEIPSEYAEYFN